MTDSARSLDRIYRYYRDFVAGKQNISFRKGDITLGEWIGKFDPKEINVIPLFEDLEHMLGADSITREYLSDKDVDHQRVFLARSDPAMNYGQVGAILMNKVALMKLHRLEEDIGVEILPIIGVGSAPFRGNLKPSTVESLMEEYPSVQTFTVQSAFKYDHPHDEVSEGMTKILEARRGTPVDVDEVRATEIINKCAVIYRDQLIKMAPLINEVSNFVPKRRKRKLHIGLFGYSRSLEGVKLPRAIGFCCAFYSIGIPPEVLGLNALNAEDIAYVREVSPRFDDNMRDALQYLNPGSLRLLPPEVGRAVDDLNIDHQINETHRKITTQILDGILSERSKGLEEAVLRAANLRRFLG